MARTYRIIRRLWRVKRPLYWGMIPELALVICVLVLFGIQQPDAFRTQFWGIGHEEGFNSSPNVILYAYANHRPLPNIPFVWSQTLTNYNVAISVVSLFVLLGKMIATIMKVFYPLFGVVVATAMTALYAVSVYGQMGPDSLDPRHPSSVAWYIRESCDIAKKYNALKNCQVAKSTFAITVLMLALYTFNLGISLWSMWPNPEIDQYRGEDDEEEYGHTGKQVEMQPTNTNMSGAGGGLPPQFAAPPNSDSPFTPRTQAFHTLDRRLPLRAQYA